MDSNKIDKEIKNECVEIMHSNLSDELKIKLITMINSQPRIDTNTVLYRNIEYPNEYKTTITSTAYGDNNG